MVYELLDFVGMPLWVSSFKKLRLSAWILGVSNLLVIIFGLVLICWAKPTCGLISVVPLVGILLVSCLRFTAMIRIGMAQQASAMLVQDSPAQSPDGDAAIRQERRTRYRKWLRWTRISILIMALQIIGAIYLLFSAVGLLFQNQTSHNCVLGFVSNGINWQYELIVLLMIMACSAALVQCFVGSDVLRWRSFYATEDNAWKAHYQEVFDHGIREALCCLGRVNYLTVSEEDEIYSVAQVLGDLVAYRASGTGHLEFLAGLALIQKHCNCPKSYEESAEVPEERIQKAAAFYPFAEAAYTGLLLDFGRNPVFFPCAWLYRQGILTPWTCHRWPVLEGDNWWRGHAAAFLKYLNLSPELLRRGRVNQPKCKAAYFVVVLHHLKSVVIAVRGTETPEDLITDGLARECSLTAEDLDGSINYTQQELKKSVFSAKSHYGHSGIVEAARDLFVQIEGNAKDGGNANCPSGSGGFLSSLLGAGCECDGYSVCIVGHSLGGSIAALLGIRLHSRYPNLHVYTYGPLPCLDSVTADACSGFVTSIVYDDEFSARLSVASIMRLRADAIMALSGDANTDSTIILKLARRFLFVNNQLQIEHEEKNSSSDKCSWALETEETNDHHNGNQCHNGCREKDQELSIWQDVNMEDRFTVETDSNDSEDSFTNPFYDPSTDVNSVDDAISQFIKSVPSSENGSSGDIPEMFLPGVVIHMVPQKTDFPTPLWKQWSTQEEGCSYRAYIANKEAFKDIIVSPSMFLDHLPWRCHYAMKKVLEMQNAQVLLDGSQMV